MTTAVRQPTPVLVAEGAAAPAPRRRRRPAPYLFVLPALVCFAVFKLYPIGWSFFLSLYKSVDGADTFVGAAN